jgi:hypothetical protein
MTRQPPVRVRDLPRAKSSHSLVAAATVVPCRYRTYRQHGVSGRFRSFCELKV